jgi:gas vesicle protein
VAVGAIVGAVVGIVLFAPLASVLRRERTTTGDYDVPRGNAPFFYLGGAVAGAIVGAIVGTLVL